MAEKAALSNETSHTGLIYRESSTQNPINAKHLGSWRFTVKAGVAVASIVFLVNLATLIWALTLDVEDGSTTVFEGTTTTALVLVRSEAEYYRLLYRNEEDYLLG
jgi:hypothetical protein